jgi:hypothetical protein
MRLTIGCAVPVPTCDRVRRNKGEIEVDRVLSEQDALAIRTGGRCSMLKIGTLGDMRQLQLLREKYAVKLRGIQ